jgi:crotonobetainyl-CoA:carnitine CoA-transferase CaiB-like acyl-CoA transferase
LDGIRIVDFTRYQQGPWGTTMLADMGAEVIKIEQRHVGDLGRALGRQADGFCAYFEAHNRGKKSLSVDVKHPEGKEIVYKLVERSDVVAHNFRPGVMERLGFGYETLKEINPRIIYAGASGFGACGPRADRPGYDIIGQGLGGIMVNQGGGPDRDPVAAMSGLSDQVGGMMFAFGIAMALIGRERRGVGQQVDTSLYGSQISLQALYLTGVLRAGVQRAGRTNPIFTAYPCADGRWLTIGVIDPDVYVPLCQALDRLDLASDERFAEPFARYTNGEALAAELGAVFLSNTRDHWLERLVEHDVPCGPVQNYIEVGEDPQALENGYITTVEHPKLGPLRVVGVPAQLSETPGSVGVAPELGQHAEEILLMLGYDRDGIAALVQAEVIDSCSGRTNDQRAPGIG